MRGDAGTRTNKGTDIASLSIDGNGLQQERLVEDVTHSFAIPLGGVAFFERVLTHGLNEVDFSRVPNRRDRQLGRQPGVPAVNVVGCLGKRKGDFQCRYLLTSTQITT